MRVCHMIYCLAPETEKRNVPYQAAEDIGTNIVTGWQEDHPPAGIKPGPQYFLLGGMLPKAIGGVRKKEEMLVRPTSTLVVFSSS